MLHSPEPAWQTASALTERAERVAKRVPRRARRLERARVIFKMYDDGATLSEISAAVGISAGWVRKSARARGVAFSTTDYRVRRAIRLAIRHERALRRIAGDLGVLPGLVLHDLIALALDDDAAIARRILHVQRRA